MTEEREVKTAEGETVNKREEGVLERMRRQVETEEIQGRRQRRQKETKERQVETEKGEIAEETEERPKKTEEGELEIEEEGGEEELEKEETERRTSNGDATLGQVDVFGLLRDLDKSSRGLLYLRDEAALFTDDETRCAIGHQDLHLVREKQRLVGYKSNKLSKLSG